jgi:type I restriction enzyme M protein
LDLQSSRLGNTVAKRSELIAKVVLSLSNIDFGEQDIKIDILGDAYEYLIGQFAASAGKKAGEFIRHNRFLSYWQELLRPVRSFEDGL